MKAPASTVQAGTEALLLGVFGISGFAALVYQVAWQRLLFGAFGVDIESITIVVSTFMLGLGIGALLGGWAADRYPRRRVQLFMLSELGIGLFGLASPWLLPAAGDYFAGASLPVTGLVNFLIVLIPATLMGSTLPILVAYFFGRSGNVGVSIGSLYLCNTLGASAGALATGLLIFTYLTIDQAIYAAAACNGLVALTVLVGSRAARA